MLRPPQEGGPFERRPQKGRANRYRKKRHLPQRTGPGGAGRTKQPGRKWSLEKAKEEWEELREWGGRRGRISRDSWKSPGRFRIVEKNPQSQRRPQQVSGDCSQ